MTGEMCQACPLLANRHADADISMGDGHAQAMARAVTDQWDDAVGSAGSSAAIRPSFILGLFCSIENAVRRQDLEVLN
jgi:hypothetical protein